MGLDKRTIKIIVICAIVALVLGTVLGLFLGLLVPQRFIELQMWPHSNMSVWDKPLIQLNTTDPDNWAYWNQKLNDFLKEYETTSPEDPPGAPCATHDSPSDACNTAIRKWAPCITYEYYGYSKGRPCVFLRLSHHNWVPEPYNMSTDLPPEMPDHIKEAMGRSPAHQYGDFVWLSCDGELPADKENIGPIEYIPATSLPGFPTKRLASVGPVDTATGKLPEPLVAVHFQNPMTGIIINVVCRIWTRDISHDRSGREGRTGFVLLVH